MGILHHHATPALAQDAVAKGAAVYAAQKCSMCHALDGKGMAKGPLDGVGSKLTADEIREWIVNPVEMTEEGQRHPQAGDEGLPESSQGRSRRAGRVPRVEEEIAQRTSMRFDLPSAARNPISLIGAAITTAMAIVFLALIALETGRAAAQPLPRAAAVRRGAGGVRARPAADPDRRLAPAPPGRRRRTPAPTGR